MIHSINPFEPTGKIPSNNTTPQERQKLFEIQFETGVLESFIAITQQKSTLGSQISKIKQGLESHSSFSELGLQVNQLIAHINHEITVGSTPFPDFNFSSETNSTHVLRNFSVSLQKLLNVAGQHNIIPWEQEQHLFMELSNLINYVGQMTPQQAFNKLSEVIESTNAFFSQAHQLNGISYVGD